MKRARVMHVRGLLLLGGLVLGCPGNSVQVPVRLHAEGCEPPSALDGATWLQVRVWGEGLEVREAQVPRSAGALDVPDIPPGEGRVVEVRAYDAAPASGGKLLARGQSLPFAVPAGAQAAGEAPAEVPVFLRRVGVFTRPGRVGEEGRCEGLLTARAGHTATLLADGRVLLAGGFQPGADGQRRALSEVEVYSPALGGFEAMPELGLVNAAQQFVRTPRAFHTATLLPSGQVLLAGGVLDMPSGERALSSALLFEPESERYAGLTLGAARAFHGAAADAEGRVLLVGGTDGMGTEVAGLEWFDPAQSTFHPVEGALPRVGMGVAPVQGGQFLAVAGGGEGSTLDAQVHFFRHEGGTFVREPTSLRLREPRRAAALVGFEDANRLLLLGGFASMAEDDAVPVLGSSELLSTGTQLGVSQGPSLVPRADVCAALLPDGRVVTSGGRRLEADGTSVSEAAMELLSPSASGLPTSLGLDPLPSARHFHTCTVLHDGSVLLAGGLTEVEGQPQALSEALLYMPVPRD